MRKITCDKCGKELQDHEALDLTVGGKVEEYFDLCPDCREALINWLAGICPCKVTKDEPDPMYDGPKNDKKGYSVYQLEGMFHRGRKAIKYALGIMKVEPAKWMGGNKLKVRYYLGEAGMAELKQRLGVN